MCETLWFSAFSTTAENMERNILQIWEVEWGREAMCVNYSYHETMSSKILIRHAENGSPEYLNVSARCLHGAYMMFKFKYNARILKTEL